MLFFIKDTHIKYLCAMIFLPKTDLAKRMLLLHSRMMAFFNTVDENTINAQCIISTAQTHFSRQRTIMIKITGSWCYEEGNDRHPATRDTR